MWDDPDLVPIPVIPNYDGEESFEVNEVTQGSQAMREAQMQM